MEEKRTAFRRILFLSLSALLGVFVVISLFAHFLRNPEPELSDAVRFKKEYPLVDEDNAFVYKNISEISDILENGTGIVFMGFPSCIWCQAYSVILHQAARDMGVSEIFYCDIKTDRENNSSVYQRIVNILEEHLELNSEGKPRVYVPDLTVVKDGVIIGHDNESSTITDDTKPDEYWLNYKVDALKKKMKAMMKEVL